MTTFPNSQTVRRIPLLLAVLLPMLAFGLAGLMRTKAAPGNNSDEATKAEALKVDQELSEAVRTKDRATLERLLADDVSWVARGDRLNKAQVIADVVSGNLHFKSLTHDTVVAKVFGTTAVVTGHSTSVLEYKGQLFAAPRLFTNVYMKLDGGWQMIAHQVSDLTPEKK